MTRKPAPYDKKEPVWQFLLCLYGYEECKRPGKTFFRLGSLLACSPLRRLAGCQTGSFLTVEGVFGATCPCANPSTLPRCLAAHAKMGSKVARKEGAAA